MRRTDQENMMTKTATKRDKGMGKEGEKEQELNMGERRERTIETWKLGTWNVRGLNGKEVELIDEFEGTGLEILTISETKRRGQGRISLNNEHTLIYSGVQQSQRAAAGVGCIIHRRINKQIINWEAVSERVLTVELKNGKGEIITVIAVYAPDENEKAEQKDKFWEELSTITEEARGRLYIAGDFNARVGRRNNTKTTSIGQHGEELRNNNGERMLDYCQIHDLIITNTFYQHRDIHKYTRVQHTKQERSIIDYILVQRSKRKYVKNVRIRRGAEIYSDHYLLVGIIKERLPKDESPTIRKYKSIRTYKLRNEEIMIKYRQITEEKFEKGYRHIKYASLEEKWSIFKNIILDGATRVCGVCNANNSKRQTAWWNGDIQEEIIAKKKEWKKYLKTKTPEQYELYKGKRKRVKELVRKAKEQSWKEFGDKMEENSKENQKLFYRVLKSFRKDQPITELYVKNKNQEILTTEKAIMERWKEYFEELLGGNEEKDNANYEELEQQNMEETEDGEQIEWKELEEVIRKLKNGKVSGSDKITSEMIKYMGRKGKTILLEIINSAWEEENFPAEWGISFITPIYKKGEHKDCNNYRGITILNTIVKIYEGIINNRIKKVIEPQLSESQSGFRPARSTQDHIFTLKQIIEKRSKQNKSLHLAFIDLKKAFDSVPRNKVWKSLENKGINKKTIRIIKGIYSNNVQYVIKNNMKSEGFTTQEGLRQGGSLSPTLFTVYMDEIIKKCEIKVKRMTIGYWKLKRIEVSEAAFADDIVLVAENERQLQGNLDIWNKAFKEEGMKINIDKTKVMTMENQQTNIYIEGNKIQQVEQYKYLGVIMDETGKQDKEINERIEKTNKLYYAISNKFIRKKEVTKQTKIKVFKAIYRTILTYGCESWTLTDRQKNKIQAVEMKYLRAVQGVTRKDRIRNTEIRRRLRVQAIMEYIQQRQLGWWGHVQRMKDDRQVKQVYEARIQGKQKRGRPRQTWNGSIGSILKEKGKSWKEAVKMAKNRDRWKKFICGD